MKVLSHQVQMSTNRILKSNLFCLFSLVSCLVKLYNMSSQNTQTSSTSNVCIDARIANEISKRVGAFLASEAGFTSINPRAHEALADAIETCA